jgi:nucleoside diphosphate kinase
MIERYFTEREEEEQHVYKSLLTDVTKKLPDDLLGFLPSLSFIMFKPDAYLRGLIPSILELFVENRVYPIKYKLKQLEASDIDSLYQFVKPKYIDSWWIMEKTYKLAPTCPTIVVGNPGGYKHLSGRIRELVGPTTPILGTESNIRYKFGGAHRIFNLIHGTDDPASAVREALVFFDFQDLGDALERAKRLKPDPDGTLPGFSLNSTEELRPKEKVELHFPSSKYHAKRELLRRFSDELSAAMGSLGSDVAEKAKPISRLKELDVRFRQLLELEGALINEQRSPKNEREALLRLYYFQQRAISLARDAAAESIVRFSRDSGLSAETRQVVIGKLARIDKYLEIARAMTTDLELKESDFDRHLAWLSAFDIALDRFDEANLHAAWSVIPTEFIDFEIKQKDQQI